MRTPTQLHRALDTADPSIRLYLFHGPDEAASRAYAARLGKGVGADAERVDFTSAQVKNDPARLVDEAASISLFGGRRWIRLDPATDDALEAITALLQAPAAGNPVAAIAGTLRKDARLLKLVADAPGTMVQASYLPEGRDADALVMEMAGTLGVLLRPDVAHRLAQATGGDRAILGQELEKLALYVDAAPEHPQPVDGEALDALGAAAEEGDLSRLTLAVFGGRVGEADAELARLGAEGIEGIPIIRALGRRALQLAQMRAEMEAGESIERVTAKTFWKEKNATADQLRRWTPARLAIAIQRLGEAERQVKAPTYPGPALVAEEVLAISRSAARGGV
jgi:DNA polymerase-3 subunit delta